MVALVASVANRGEERAEGRIVARVDGAQVEQSARVVELGPGQQAQVPILVYLPKSIMGKKSINVVLTMMVKDGSREVTLVRRGAPVTHSMRLLVENVATVAGLAIQPAPQELPFWFWPKSPIHSAYELAVATRVDSGNSRQTASYRSKMVPIEVAALESLDVIIVDDETVLRDAASREAIERYLATGGRVWIMADQVDTRLLRGLLEDGQTCETVDVLQVNSLVIDINSQFTRLAEEDRTLDLPDPVAFKRVVQTGANVTHASGQWPIVMRMPIGFGELVITTLDASAWIEPRTEKKSNNPLAHSAYQSKVWANQFASSINELRSPLPLEGQSVAYPLQQIGNPVVPRSWVLIALAIFCALLCLAGGLRMLGWELSWIGIIAPALSCVCGGGLLAASMLVRSDIPESVSKLQVVEFGSDGRFALVREQAAVHLEASRSMRLDGEFDGKAMTTSPIATGTATYEQQDLQSWRLENENWPAGNWRYDTAFVLPARSQTVTVEMTESGVQLRQPDGLPSPLEDPVLAYAPGNMMLCEGEGNDLFTDGTLAADGSRWVTASLISQEQQLRTEVYQRYFDLPERGRPLSRVLMGWTKPFAGPRWNTDLVQQGSALAVLPVKLARPVAGKSVYLPHGLVRFSIDPNEIGQTLAYSATTGKWEKELTMGATARLQLELPPQVLPFAAETIDFELDIDAPHRNVKLEVRTVGGMVELASLENPSIPWSKTITDPAVLSEVRDGKLSVVLTVGERTDVASGASTTNVVAWDVNHLRASLRGSRVGDQQ
ncbi:MAG: hypothetical protein Aurels2KO_14220 [Aureliella sp.]